jgi:hypothetical protein
MTLRQSISIASISFNSVMKTGVPGFTPRALLS